MVFFVTVYIITILKVIDILFTVFVRMHIMQKLDIFIFITFLDYVKFSPSTLNLICL